MAAAGFIFVSAAVLGFVLTHAVRAFALRSGALDHALVSRKIHRRPIPRLGGVAIVTGFFASFVVLPAVPGAGAHALVADRGRAIALLVGGAMIAAVGILDDVRGVRARTKLLVQVAAAGIAYWLGFRVDEIGLPLGGNVHLGVLGLPFTVLWIAGVINALNLIDGLDGLAGGVAVIAAVSIAVVAGMHGDTLMVLAATALAGVSVGFLWFNFHPASIFMGDTGSMFLGFVLATTSIRASAVGSDAVGILVPIVALGIPIGDTLLAMVRRAARGVPIGRGDREHIHHRLLDLGLSHRKSVLVIYAGSAALGGVAFLVASASRSRALWLMLALAGAAYVVLRQLGYIDLSGAQQLMRQRHRNLQLRSSLRRVGVSIGYARTHDELWRATKTVLPAFGASCIGIGIATPGEEPLVYRAGFDEEYPGTFRVRYGLTPERPDANFVELGWSDGRKQIDRDTEIAVELLCEHVAEAVERMTPPEIGDARVLAISR